MPFFDVDLEVRVVSTRKVSLTVEAGSREEARAHAIARAEAEAEWPADPGDRFERGAVSAVVRSGPVEADLIGRSPERRFLDVDGIGWVKPLHPRGVMRGNTALWTDEAELAHGEHGDDVERTPVPRLVIEIVAAFEEGRLPLVRHSGRFSDATVVLAKQMGCALVWGHEHIALLVRLGTRQCVGFAVGRNDRESNAPELPEGWADGRAYAGGPLTHQGRLDLGESLGGALAAPITSRSEAGGE